MLIIVNVASVVLVMSIIIADLVLTQHSDSKGRAVTRFFFGISAPKPKNCEVTSIIAISVNSYRRRSSLVHNVKSKRDWFTTDALLKGHTAFI